MSYETSVRQGNVTDVLQRAILYGTLWAIGSAWSTAIRESAIAILPNTNEENIVVLMELGAATLTTVIAVGIAFIAVNVCRPARITPPPPPLPRPPARWR